VTADVPAHGPRPDAVRTAVTLLYATLGLGVLRSALESARLAAESSVVAFLAIALVSLGLTGFLTYMTGRGRNWARITLLVLFLIGVPLSMGPLATSLATSPVSGVLGLAQVGLQVVALVLLFRPPASTWFRRP
jgi:hypothetical protein